MVLERDGVKREIEAPFNICIGAADAEVLIEQLRQWIDGGGMYGWFQIWPKPEGAPIKESGTPPLKWSE